MDGEWIIFNPHIKFHSVSCKEKTEIWKLPTSNFGKRSYRRKYCSHSRMQLNTVSYFIQNVQHGITFIVVGRLESKLSTEFPQNSFCGWTSLRCESEVERDNRTTREKPELGGYVVLTYYDDEDYSDDDGVDQHIVTKWTPAVEEKGKFAVERRDNFRQETWRDYEEV